MPYYCYLVTLAKIERIVRLKRTPAFSAFESDCHLSQSFETSDTKVDHAVKGQQIR